VRLDWGRAAADTDSGEFIPIHKLSQVNNWVLRKNVAEDKNFALLAKNVAVDEVRATIAEDRATLGEDSLSELRT
jgi:hypothetical protein